MNPQGILDIGMHAGRARPHRGGDAASQRPGPGVAADLSRFALDALLAVSRIRPSQLDAALDAGDASAEVRGHQPSARRSSTGCKPPGFKRRPRGPIWPTRQSGEPVDEIRVERPAATGSPGPRSPSRNSRTRFSRSPSVTIVCSTSWPLEGSAASS